MHSYAWSVNCENPLFRSFGHQSLTFVARFQPISPPLPLSIDRSFHLSNECFHSFNVQEQLVDCISLAVVFQAYILSTSFPSMYVFVCILCVLCVLVPSWCVCVCMFGSQRSKQPNPIFNLIRPTSSPSAPHILSPSTHISCGPERFIISDHYVYVCLFKTLLAFSCDYFRKCFTFICRSFLGLLCPFVIWGYFL